MSPRARQTDLLPSSSHGRRQDDLIQQGRSVANEAHAREAIQQIIKLYRDTYDDIKDEEVLRAKCDQ
eukprot:5080926-Pyramimonas_sp.AAC.3